MANNNKWETVRKPNKKQPTKRMTKAEKQAYTDNAPRIIASPPLKESKTLYDAFIEQDKKATEHHQSSQEHKNGIAGKQQSPSQQKKKKPHVQKDHKEGGGRTLEEVAKELSSKSLEKFLNMDQTKFPDNPTIWLKDLASYLNLELHVPEKDPLFTGQPVDYPLCKLPKVVQKLMLTTMRKSGASVQQLFLEHCVRSTITDSSKGLSTYGYRVCIQSLLHANPQIVTDDISKYNDMLKSNQSHPIRCALILWALSQAGVKNLGTGLRVWLDVMLPLLGVRSMSGYVVSNLESLFSCHDNLQSAYGVVGMREFFQILDIVYASNSSLSHALQKRMLKLYPKIKTLAFGECTKLSGFFPSLMSRLTPTCPTPLKEELLACLATCLTKDNHCYSPWRQMYEKHLRQSSILMDHLLAVWSMLKIDVKQLRDTVRSFMVTNDDLATAAAQPGGRRPEGHDECVRTCKELMAKMSGWKFPSSCWLLVLAALGGVIVYDVHQHSGFKGSRTRAVLHDTGVLAVAEHVWQRTEAYTEKSWRWLQHNIPYYYSRACAFSAPYLTLMCEKLRDAFDYVVEQTEEPRQWLYLHLAAFVEQVRLKLPGPGSACSCTRGNCAELLWHYGCAFCKEVRGSLSIENIQKTLVPGRLGDTAAVVTMLQLAELMAKMSGWKFPKFLLLLVLAALGGVIVYDVHQHSGFKGEGQHHTS
ncbi:PREDICTED: transmembrane protein 214-like [Priapulus caudatus]|uniref:Transmembrane protein 214-like n=1 Tax=Priapulus caudatus TaxID=37621 RepID=A0ABM1E9S2_PRICU|nr:PREDICTED: transmembrane protein 214-like [Priapulus caudatus]